MFHDLRSRTLALFTAAAVCLLASFNPSKADIEVRRDSPHAEVWRTLYSQLPSAFKTRRVVLVREVSDREMERLLAESGEDGSQSEDDGEIQAFYDRSRRASEPDTITIRQSLRSEEAAFVFTHEYGHMVWEQLLSKRQRRDYEDIWQHQRRARRLVTSYAADSVEEGFSEAVATYVRQPERLRRRDSESWAFVRDLVRAAEEEEARESSRR